MRYMVNGDLCGGIGGQVSSYWPLGGVARSLGQGLRGAEPLDNDTIVSANDAIVHPGTGRLGALVWLTRASGWNPQGKMLYGQYGLFTAGGGVGAGTIQVGSYVNMPIPAVPDLPTSLQSKCYTVSTSPGGVRVFIDFQSRVQTLWPNGTAQDMGPVLSSYAFAYDDGVIRWDGAKLLATDAETTFDCAIVAGAGPTLNKPTAVVDGNGLLWVSYASAVNWRVLHPWNSAERGYFLTQGWSPDLMMLGGQCHPAVALNAGETFDSLMRDAPIVLGQNMVSLAPPSPVIPMIPRFVHPTTVAVFFPAPK